MKTKIYWFMLALATLMSSCEQETTNPVLEISDTSYTFDATGGTFETSIISSSEWNAQSTADWLSIDPQNGHQQGETTVRITATANGTSIREAVVSISNEDGITKEIQLRQVGEEPYLIVTPEQEIVFESNGGSQYLNIESNIKWEATCNVEWISINQAYQDDKLGVNIIASANEEVAERSATIYISGDGVETKNISIKQKTYENVIIYTTSDNNKISISSSNFDAEIIDHIYTNGTGMIVFASPVTEIKNNAFLGESYLTSITLPKGITSIGEEAFQNCRNLMNITIPEGVTNIGNYAFVNCEKMENIELPNSLLSIGDFVFKNCTTIKNITIPEGVTNIGDWAFDGCNALENIELPNSLLSLGDHVFLECTSLKSLTIPEGVTSIGSSILYFGGSRTPQLTEIVWNADYMPYTIISFDQSYSGSTLSIDFTYGNKITYITELPIDDDVKIKTLTIPESVKKISSWCFNGYNIQKVKWNAANAIIQGSIGSKLFSEGQIKEFEFGNTVKTIPGYFCYNIEGLTSLNIPDNVEEIGHRAFQYCKSLRTITIGTGLECIGSNVFYNCANAFTLYCKATTPPIGIIGESYSYNWLGYSTSGYNISIYVPVNSVSTYKQNYPWKHYENKIYGYNF